MRVPEGATPATFIRLETPLQSKAALDRVDRSKGKANEPALLCINDDVKYQPDFVEKALRLWLRRKWSQPAAWETSTLSVLLPKSP